jgi:hypothetical protein
MSTKTNSEIDTEKLRDIVRDEVTRQLKQARFRDLQKRLAPYRENTDYESEEEFLNDNT